MIDRDLKTGPQAIPVTVLTGFLGPGKITLLNRTECIVLEASGVAEPLGIVATFMDAHLHERIRLDSIMCVVDASQVFDAPETMELKLRQIACADMLILNKADLVDVDEIARIHAWLDERFHRYRLVESIRGEVPLEILLSSGRFEAVQLQGAHSDLHRGHSHHGEDHTSAFSTWSYETDQALSLDALRQAASRLPANIYRCKGVIHSADAPGRRAILQVVGKRADISLADEWGDRSPGTRIVAIGAHGTVDGEALRATFDHCVATSGLIR